MLSLLLVPEVKSALGVDEVVGYCRIHDESVNEDGGLFIRNAEILGQCATKDVAGRQMTAIYLYPASQPGQSGAEHLVFVTTLQDPTLATCVMPSLLPYAKPIDRCPYSSESFSTGYSASMALDQRTRPPD